MGGRHVVLGAKGRAGMDWTLHAEDGIKDQNVVYSWGLTGRG